MTATALILSTPSWMVVAGNSRRRSIAAPSTPENYRIIRFRGSFGGSELFASNNPCSIQSVILDADSRTLDDEMDKAHNEHTITHVEYDHMQWANITLRDDARYRQIRAWCSKNHVPLVVDAVLSFLMLGCGALAYQRALGGDDHIAHPDFIWIGKAAGLAVMISTDAARRTLRLSDQEFITFLS